MKTSAAATSESPPRRATTGALCERGLERCRSGNWEEGLLDLTLVVKDRHWKAPALCYAYLGYGLAKYHGQVKEGIRFCRRAIKLEFFQPESYLNLARTALLSEKYRKEAANAVKKGLKIDPEHPELLRLQAQLGERRPPVLHFLSRGHFLNRIVGFVRHQLKGRPSPWVDEPDPEAPVDPSDRARP